MTDHATGTLAEPRIDAEILRSVLTSFRDALAAHRGTINDLNVYPVPDGDTGTNMALTMASVVEAVAAAGPSMAETCEALAHGALMGARGNSGVILSQVLRGIADVFAAVEEADAVTLAR
jgi:dihydroxyacetone kinase-like predicted kinase